MLSRILGIGLLLSLAANGVTASLYYRAKAETQTLVSEAALAANLRWKDASLAQAAAAASREAELLRRLEQSDQVTREALDRLEDRNDELRSFRARVSAERAENPTYDAWAAAELPAGVADRLKALQ